MRNRLLVCALLLSVGCVKRIAPTPVESRTALSGTPVAFGAPQVLPEGTTVHWSFGDGTPEQLGAQVVHVFPRAGNFTVTETVLDKDGEKRSLTASALILRRAVSSAVPADARAVLVLERPWSHVQLQRKVARRVGLGEFFDESARGVSELFGFQADDPAAAEANGVDTDEGLALYTVPQDLEALVACAGVADAEKAAAALRHLLEHDRGGPFALHEAALADGTRVMLGERGAGAEQVAYLARQGYLYLRMPGRSDPLLALASAARLDAGTGLEKDPGFIAATAHTGPGDAVFYSAGKDSAAPATRFSNQLGASAFTLVFAEEQATMHAWAQLRDLSGKQLVDAFTPATAPPELASQLPQGAALFAKLSGAPPIIWRSFVKALGPDGTALHDRLHDLLGGDVEAQLLPSFTGNGAVALYLDAQSLIEAMLGEQVASLDRSTIITMSELKPGADAPLRAALEHASQESGGGHPVRTATFWKLSDGVQVAIRDGFMFTALGGTPDPEPPAEEDRGADKSGRPKGTRRKSHSSNAKRARDGKATPVRAVPHELTAAEIGPLAAILFAQAGTPTLAAQLPLKELALGEKSAQLGWIDLHGSLARLQAAADEQGGMVSTAVRMLVDRVRGLRDALIDARAQEDGFTATLTLRFQPESAIPSPGHAEAGHAGLLRRSVRLAR